MKEKGFTPPEYSKKWDSNAITPGTTFMIGLNERIKQFIRDDLMTNADLSNVKIIFNSSEVPGEGEHKIMNFIRQQRLYPSYNANTKHCIYGLDADLIILSLATHEVNIKILRESNNTNNNIKMNNVNDIIYNTPYEILNISTLREYLARVEFSSNEFNNLKFELNFEHVIDDFIFLIMFVGNDFLPHIPSINIREGAIDVMIFYYKKYLSEMNGYLIENNTCQFDKISKYLCKLEELEPIIFKLRVSNQKSYEDYLVKKTLNEENNKTESVKRLYNNKEENESNKKICCNIAIALNDGGYSDNDNYKYSKLLKKEIYFEDSEEEEEKEEEMEVEDEKENDINNDLFRNKIHEKCYNQHKLVYNDIIHLDEDGYKERYYKNKFEIKNNMRVDEFSKLVSVEYMKGIEWVLNYYYQGCCSWNWFYPFHYSPFLSDLSLIHECSWKFDLNKPFTSNQQLMAVLPSKSYELVPKAYQSLMIDCKSPIFDFYKNDYKIDPNGNYQPWLYVTLLPPINEELLLKTLECKENELSEEEKRRNLVGEIILFISNKNSCYEVLLKYLEKNEFVVIPDIGLNGLIKKIDKDNSISYLELNYRLEEPFRKHIPRLLSKSVLPPMILNENDSIGNMYLRKGIVYKYVLEHFH